MDERTYTTDSTVGFDHESPAGAAAVDDELTKWEELLSADVNEHKRRRDMEFETDGSRDQTPRKQLRTVAE